MFCGEEANFKVLLSRTRNRRHEALMLGFPDSNVSHADLIQQDQTKLDVFTLARKRGKFAAPRLRVLSYFPLGLCRTWSVVKLNQHCVVYPKPVAFDMSQFNSGSVMTCSPLPTTRPISSSGTMSAAVAWDCRLRVMPRARNLPGSYARA